MIHNEIITSKDVPDDYHQALNNLLIDMFDSLHILSGNPEYGDGRLFLSALSIVHAEFLAVLMHSLEGKIERKEYLKNEMAGFLKNFELISRRWEEK